MQFYKFQFFISDAGYTFEQLSYDAADIFDSLGAHPLIESTDLCITGGEMASILVATKNLSVEDIEQLLIAKFNEKGRNPQNYILLTPDTAEQ